MDFAVSSLCASTAASSAAAIGLTWAINRQQTASPPYPSDERPVTAVRRSSSRRSFLPRPKSAIVTSSHHNPWNSTPGPPARTTTSHQSGTPVESLQETEEAEDTASELVGALPQRLTSTSFRQRLTLTPSSDRSSQATDTPSTYTNASNTPFLPTPLPRVASRNRLVKRSASQKVPTHGPVESASTRAAFRRPATSHQRIAETRANAVRHRRSHSSAAPSPCPGRDSAESSRKKSSAWNWEPFFRKYTVRVKAPVESSLKSPGDLFLSRKDELHCVSGPPGQLPTLVMATSITQISVEQEFDTPTHLRHAHYSAYQPVNEPSSAPTGRVFSQFREDFPERMSNTGEPEPRAGSGFSLGNLLPSPSPAPFRIVRRRSSRKQEPGNGFNATSRHVSESRLTSRSRRGDNPTTFRGDPETSDDGRITKQRLPHARSVSDVAAAYRDSRSDEDAGPDGHVINPKSREAGIRGQRHSFSSGTGQAGSSPLLKVTPQRNQRDSRGSRVASDHGSTVHGSDTDNSRVFSVSGDEYDTFSDTNYDSFRTGGTNSSLSAPHTTRLEGVFDEWNKEPYFGDELSVLEEKLSDASFASSPRHAEDNGASPSKSIHLQRGEGPSTDGSKQRDHNPLPRSSPVPTIESPSPALFNRMPTATSKQNADLLDDLDALWDVPEEGSEHQMSPAKPNQVSYHISHTEYPADIEDLSEPQKKVNLWDWSEKTEDDERPRTVHGKNPTDRGNRAGSRRPNIHARSQSVPSVIDNSKARFNDSSKLDAWTLGGKGVSEDWDEDFDVGDLEEEPAESGPASVRQSRDFRSSGFVVPDTILEKQSSVHGAFKHVRELSLLVEDLRRLRRTADDLGIRNGQSSALWVEAEGIIDLATLEEDDELAPPVAARPASPTSTDFDFDSEERISTPASARQVASVTRDETSSRNSPARHMPGLSNGGNASPSLTPRSASHANSTISNTPPAATRPRQGSIAQAKTVLEHIHSHRADEIPAAAPNQDVRLPTNPSTPTRAPRSQKQPFDTQSLKDLVVRAGVVTRALQSIVHAAQEQRHIIPLSTPSSHERSGSGLGIGSDEIARDPFLSQLFQHPGPLTSTPPSQRRSPFFKREREGTPGTPSGRDWNVSGPNFESPNLTQKMKQVTILDE